MNRVYIDTSALYALYDDTDARLRIASSWLRANPVQLVTHEATISELVALLDRRVGPQASDAFVDHMLPNIEVLGLSRDGVAAAVQAYRSERGRRRPSLVDHLGFELMREQGIVFAFAFDSHFADRGFIVVPRS